VFQMKRAKRKRFRPHKIPKFLLRLVCVAIRFHAKAQRRTQRRSMCFAPLRFSPLRLCVKKSPIFKDPAMTTLRFTLLTLVLALHGASAVRQNGAKPLVLKDCDVQGLVGKAKCGTLEVYEDRAARKGRKINLNIVVLPATSAQREPDPLFYFAGGPGSAATED